MTPRDRVTLVVPTLGRPSLVALLDALAQQTVAVDAPVLLVDDRPSPDGPLALDGARGPRDLDVRVVPGGGRGPAHARNVGWRRARTPWVAFLDDDVVPERHWWAELAADLDEALACGAAGTAGRVHVPLPRDRRPTDWERGTRGLETARWITADMAYRRDALAAVGGFDERFPRAFREDADLGLRLTAAGAAILTGRREVQHPVRPADDRASVRQQAGNADDRLMARLHGRGWHARAGEVVGRLPRHAAVVAAGALGAGALLAGRPRLAALAAAGWLAGTAELAAARIAPGPRDRAEVRRMVVTSAQIPAAACWHAASGWWRHRGAQPWRGLPDLVLLDRDGTLVHDVPYNTDPDLVRPVDGARAALDRLRAEGVRLGIVTNQSAVGRGLATRAQVDAVTARVVELVGPVDGTWTCPHAEDDGCGCRKPAPGMVKQACAELGVDPHRCVVVGDIGSDVAAALAAGAHALLVPTAATRPEEVAAAAGASGTGSPRTGTAASLVDAVDRVLRGDW